MNARFVGWMFTGLVSASGAWAEGPVNPNLSPEFPVPSTLPDATRPAPRAYDCTLARGLGDCSQTPGPPPAIQGTPSPPPPRLPSAPDGDVARDPASTMPGVPKGP